MLPRCFVASLFCYFARREVNVVADGVTGHMDGVVCSDSRTEVNGGSGGW